MDVEYHSLKPIVSAKAETHDHILLNYLIWQINLFLKLNSTQPEITDAGVWHLYVRIINNKTIL